MPNWRTHNKTAKGMQIGKTTAKRVNMLLDFPDKVLSRSAGIGMKGMNLTGLTHKSLHNPMGILLAQLLYGQQAGQFAMAHLIDDMWHEAIKKAMGNTLYRI